MMEERGDVKKALRQADFTGCGKPIRWDVADAPGLFEDLKVLAREYRVERAELERINSMGGKSSAMWKPRALDAEERLKRVENRLEEVLTRNKEWSTQCEKVAKERDDYRDRIREFDKSIDSELRDPNGTIWEVANKFLKELKKELKEEERCRLTWMSDCQKMEVERDEARAEFEQLKKLLDRSSWGGYTQKLEAENAAMAAKVKELRAQVKELEHLYDERITQHKAAAERERVLREALRKINSLAKDHCLNPKLSDHFLIQAIDWAGAALFSIPQQKDEKACECKKSWENGGDEVHLPSCHYHVESEAKP